MIKANIFQDMKLTFMVTYYPYSAGIYYIYKIFYSIYAKRDTLLLSRIKPSLRQFEFGASLATKVLLTFCV